MFVVDTNILLYAVNPDSPDHARAREALESWRAGERSWFLTWGIIYEFLRVSTHSRVFPNPLAVTDARDWIDAALSTANAGLLVETDRHPEILREVLAAHPRASGNLLHDVHTATLMKEHGVEEIQTADNDFHQFPFLRVVNPLSGR